MKREKWTSYFELGLITSLFVVAVILWKLDFFYSSIMCCVGVISYLSYNLYLFKYLEKWKPVKAVLKRCKTKKYIYSSKSLTHIYLADCLYEYKINKTTYTTKRVTLKKRDSMTQDINIHNMFMRELKNKKSVYVNPNKPDEAVICRDRNSDSVFVLFVSIVVFLFFLVLMNVMEYKREIFTYLFM